MQPTDANLVAAARSGDRQAFVSLCQHHRPLLIAACRRVLRDPHWAEDAAQEALVVAYLQLDRLRRPERFGAWLCGIGIHVCRGWLRLQSTAPWSLDGLLGGRFVREPLDSRPSAQSRVEQDELASSVRFAIEALPSGQRAAVALFYLDGLTYAEVASALGIEVGSVKTRLHNARHGLARSLWSTWKELTMATETESATVWADVELEDVTRVAHDDPPSDRSALVLKEIGGERLLPIWVGAFEGDAAAIMLVGAETPRPLTYPFTARLLEAAGGRVVEVHIVRLVDETFFAEVVIDSARGTRTVDARPSDAVALALATGAPIRVERGVLDTAGRTHAELAEKRPEGMRSARAASESIRSRTAQFRGQPVRSALF